MPDDLDGRLRQAFHHTSTAWQPSDVSTEDVVAGVRRQRARRRRRTTTISCVAVVVLALGVGAYRYSSTPHRLSASAGSATSAPVAGGSTASSGAAPSSAGTVWQQALGACPASVQVGSATSRCVGVLSSPTLDQQRGFSAASNGAAAGAPVRPGGTVKVKVGQQIKVTLALTPVGGWGAPGVSTLSASDRPALGIGSTTPAGTVHTLTTAREIGTRPASAVFEAVRPGVVVLTAHLGGPCATTSSAPARTDSPSCTGVQTRWSLVLLVVAR
jgi:hypothetical protein